MEMRLNLPDLLLFLWISNLVNASLVQAIATLWAEGKRHRLGAQRYGVIFRMK